MGFIADFFAGGSKDTDRINALSNLQFGPTTNLDLNLQKYLDQSNAVRAPASADSSFRQGQQDLVSALQAQSSGQGPSLAQMQLQQGTDQALAAQAAQAASARGVDPALAQRLALQNSANIQQQQAGQSGMLRLQEQQQSQNALAQALQGARSQDLNVAQMGQQEQARKDAFLQALMGQALARDQSAAQTRLSGLQGAGNLYESGSNRASQGIGSLFKTVAGVGSGIATGGASTAAGGGA